MIRKVVPGDASDIAGILNHYIVNTDIVFDFDPVDTEEMRRRITEVSASYPYYVWEHDGRVRGFAYVHPWKSRPAYSPTLETTIYLAPGEGRKGVGTELMKKLISDCREAGFRSLIACITSGNTASEHFHSRLGFRKVSEFRDVGFKHSRWLSVTDWQLMLYH